MDQERFDTVARFLAAKPSRRTIVGSLATALLFASDDATAGKSGRGKRRGKNRGSRNGRSRRQSRSEQLPANCCNTGNCTPGKGKNLARCCYEDGDVSGRNFSGANLGSANFSGTNASGANFNGANLGKTCLVDANLTGARINGSTNLAGAIFCRTTMPDGSTNDSGCGNGSRCCPTCAAAGQPCGPDVAPCCGDAECVGGVCSACRDDNAFACGVDGDACGPACAANQSCVDGACVSCAEACSDPCSGCARLVDGSTTCVGTVSVGCDNLCAATADCPVFESCVLTITNAGGTVIDVAGGCDAPAGIGVCLDLSDC